MRSIPRPLPRALGSVAILALAAGWALFAGPAPAAPGWNGEITQENGIPLVVNPEAPPADQQVLAAIERWRLGGENQDDPLLGQVTDIQLDRDGNAYLLDSNLSLIHVLSPKGAHLRAIGREGDGPGEFRRARRLALLPDGTVGVMEMMPGQIVVMQPDGTPSPSLELEGFDGGMRHFESLAVNGHGLVVGGVTTSLDQGGAVIRRSLSRFDASGKRIATLLSSEETQTGGAIRLGRTGNDFIRYWGLCPDGRVAVYGRDHDYRIEIYGLDGGLELIVTRKYESLRRTDKDLVDQRKQDEELSARFGGVSMGEIDLMERDITLVVGRPDGTFWVATSRGARECPAGAVGVFDVLDDQGRLVRTLRIGADYDPERDNFLVRGNRLFVLKEAQMISTTMSGGGGGGQQFAIVMAGRSDEGDEEEARPFEVICYELP